MEGTVLEDILLLLAATIAVVVGLRRLRMPPIIGFLAVGMTVGPHALGWVATTNLMSHPKIPNYEIVNIPRDPGRSTAYNVGGAPGTPPPRPVP